MADQHNPNIPVLTNQVANDIPDISENLEFHKDVFENFINEWSNTDATDQYPAYWNRTAIINTDSPYTMLAADIIIEVDASAGAVEVDLVEAASYAKRYVIIKCTDSTNNVTIDPNGAETIDGASSKILYEDDQCIMIYSDGTNWQTIFYYAAGTLLDNDTYLKSVNAAGSGTVDLIKATPADQVQFGEQATVLLAEQVSTINGDTHTTTTIDGIADTSAINVGMTITGTDIPAATTVATIVDGVSITISQAATGTTAGVDFTLINATAADQGLLYIQNYHGQPEAYFREESNGDEVLLTNRGFAPLPQGWKYGMELSNAAGDADHDILIQTGAVRDSTDVTDIRLAATMLKRLDAAWTSGSANGGLMFTEAVGDTHNATAVLDSIPDTSHIKVGMTVTGTGVGAAALVVSIDSGTQITVDVNSTADGSDITFTFGIAPSTTYHFFVFRNDTTGATDAGFDTSLTCANIPAGYTYYRRIGGVLTDATFNILGFQQWGDIFRFDTPVLDVSEATQSGVYASKILSVPKGISVEAFGNLYAAEEIQVRPVNASDAAPQALISPLGISDYAKWFCVTDTSGQVQIANSDAEGAIYMTTEGWRDFF